MRIPITVLALTVLASQTIGQITDIQFGRNFQTAINAFGGGRSENVDVGDVDNDGDYDVLIANGGDGSAQDNWLYANNGGAQGGAVGTFTNVSGSQLIGVPADTSRDCEFADFEADGDLDIYISNRGTTVNGGEVSRAYANQGGLQVGTMGVYLESTGRFWGNLVSVPLSDEVGPQDGQGPWKDFSCDCDFADIDDDGDIDLFHSSYGPNINGTTDSRVFLNNGNGIFDELWPWANAGADIRLHTLDIDPMDIDGDYDIDIFASSRDSQARVYRNNLGPSGWAGDPFTDVTQSALLDQGAGLSGSANYEGEPADLDGDGDIDYEFKNYNGLTDRIVRNDGNGRFTQMNSWIKGDPNVDENEVDFIDFDSDGDLDIFAANFSGTSWIYTSGVAQGITEYHRNGTTNGGSVASWPEVPSNANNAISLDGECADMDNDGDPDILIANDNNSQNRYWQNSLGVPDTHAPTFFQFTVQGDKSDGTDTVIHAQVRDNAPYYIIAYYDARLVYSVDGGAEVCQKMFSQGAEQFRGVIPGAVDGSVSYRIEVTDDNGNTGVSATTNYTQTSTSASEWQLIDCGTQGVYGVPYLTGYDTGANATINLSDAAPNAAAVVWMGVSSTPLAFKGGTLYVFPIIINIPLTTGAGGEIVFKIDLSVFPTGFPIYWQAAAADVTAQGGVSLSNAVLFTAP